MLIVAAASLSSGGLTALFPSVRCVAGCAYCRCSAHTVIEYSAVSQRTTVSLR